MTKTDAKLLADLEAAEARATRGPWEFRPTLSSSGRECEECGAFVDPCGPSIVAPIPPATEPGCVSLAVANLDGGPSRDAANGAFIAAARNALPRLLALVKAQDEALDASADAVARLTTRIGTLEEALAGLAGDYMGSPCWCDMRIGHPNVKTHSAACEAARKVVDKAVTP